MMCTSAASSRKGEQQRVPSQGKQKKPPPCVSNHWKHMGEVDRAGKSKSRVILHRRARLMGSLRVHLFHNSQRTESLASSKSCSSRSALEACSQMAKAWEEVLGWSRRHAAGENWSLLGFAVPCIEPAAGQWHSSTQLGYREQHSSVLLSWLGFCLISRGWTCD